MARFKGVTLRLGLAALLIPFMAACLPAPTPSPTTPSPTQSPSANPSELTADENLALNPPAPVDVAARQVADGVELTWGPPPPVTVPHRYSDTVIGYRVYRRGPGELEFAPIATPSGRAYVDRSITGPGRFEYVVSSIREHNVEGSRSDPPAIVTIG